MRHSLNNCSYPIPHTNYQRELLVELTFRSLSCYSASLQGKQLYKITNVEYT